MPSRVLRETLSRQAAGGVSQVVHWVRFALGMHRCFSQFDEIVLSFQVVATLGRIETARLGGSNSDLGHFADEARSYSQSTRERVERALQAAAGLESYIGRAIQHVSEGDSRQLEALPSLVSAIEEALAALRLRQQAASAASLRLADEFTGFTETINGLVEALQFHDITRQQVEHVVDAPHGGSTACPSAEVVGVVDLQRHQRSFAGALAAVVNCAAVNDDTAAPRPNCAVLSPDCRAALTTFGQSGCKSIGWR